MLKTRPLEVDIIRDTKSTRITLFARRSVMVIIIIIIHANWRLALE